MNDKSHQKDRPIKIVNMIQMGILAVSIISGAVAIGQQKEKIKNNDEENRVQNNDIAEVEEDVSELENEYASIEATLEAIKQEQIVQREAEVRNNERVIQALRDIRQQMNESEDDGG